MAHGWAAPPLVDPAPAAVPDTLTRFVEELAALPGAEYVLAVDADGHRVLGETGGPPGSDLAVLDWARRVAAVSRERRHALEDLVLTTERAYHVARLVPVDLEAPDDRAAWVTVRIDRGRGNLALSRRAVARLGVPGAPSWPRALPAASPGPATGAFPAGAFPAGSPGPATGSPGPATGAFPAAMPAPAGGSPAGPPELPAPRGPEPGDGHRHAWPRPEERAAAKAQLIRELAAFAPGYAGATGGDQEGPAAPGRPRDAPDGPSADEVPAQVPSARRLPLSIRQASRWRDADGIDEPGARIPAARTSPETGSPPPAASLFTPATPAPAAWPTRDEDTGELSVSAAPAVAIRPRPYVPDPGPAKPLPDPWPAPRTGLHPWPAPDAGPDPDASDDVADLPRRRPGAHLGPRPAAPRSVPTAHHVVAAAGTAAFTTEPSVLRRLLDGLRRLT